MDDELLLQEQRTALKALEIIRRDIQAGEAIEFVGMTVNPEGKYRLVGGSTTDRHKTAGMLLELAIERLTDSKE